MKDDLNTGFEVVIGLCNEVLRPTSKLCYKIFLARLKKEHKPLDTIVTFVRGWKQRFLIVLHFKMEQ
jgi:hypothetical protein